MALTVEQLRLREGRITASFVPYLMAGNEAKILSEWRRLVGDPDYAPEDLSDSWPVQFGSFIESFALDWHERKTGRFLTRRGEVVYHPERPYVCCTLDAFRDDDLTVIDCKAIGMWRKLDEALPHYVPQMIVQRACTRAINAALLVVHGGSEPTEMEVVWEADYEREVWARIEWFNECVENLTPPVSIEPAKSPVAPTRIIDMSASNAWAEHAAKWSANFEAAKRFKSAEKDLKALVPEDAKCCQGHGIEVKRDKAGKLSIKEMAA